MFPPCIPSSSQRIVPTCSGGRSAEVRLPEDDFDVVVGEELVRQVIGLVRGREETSGHPEVVQATSMRFGQYCNSTFGASS